MPDMKRDEVIALLQKEGWTIIRSHGSHMMMERDGVRQRIAVGSTGMGGGGLKEILRRFDIPLEGVFTVSKNRPLSDDEMRMRGISAPKAGTIGRRIFDSRRALGLTQAQVASKLGLTNKAVGFYEQGRNSPPPDKLQLLGEMFDWPEYKVIKRADQQITSVETGALGIGATEQAVASNDERPEVKTVQPRVIRDLDHPERLAESASLEEIEEAEKKGIEAVVELAEKKSMEKAFEYPEELEKLRTAILDKKHKLGFSESSVSREMSVGMETLADLIHRRKTEFASSSLKLMRVWAGIPEPEPERKTPAPQSEPINITVDGSHVEKLSEFNEWVGTLLRENNELRNQVKSLKVKAEKWDFFKEMTKEED